MPLKPKPISRSSCDKYKRTSSTERKITTKTPKKILISRKWHLNCSHEVKSKSAGIIDSKEQSENPNKTSRSLPAVPKHSKTLDFCKTCGDTDDIETAIGVFSNTSANVPSKSSIKVSKSNTKENKPEDNTKQVKIQTKVVQEFYKNEKFKKSHSAVNYTKTKTKSVKIKTKKTKEALKNGKKEVEKEQSLKEHYLNENFADLYDSTHDIDNFISSGPILDTIVEDNEKQASTASKSVISSKTSLESNICIQECSDDDVSLNHLKEFREKNYFECHSAKNRVKSKGSVISLKEHKCSYRLYLNDRLFPVAMDDDHNDSIRCVDCHLPLELSSKADKPNGTIQAKVKLGNETQDMVLLLPIKEPLIIKQKRRERKDDDVVYFGVVRLNQNGDSIFSRSLPSDSLALRYQKGYRQYHDDPSYRYEKVEESDVIVI